MPDHYQRSRYELKYLVDEARARQVRDFVRSYLRRDPHAKPELRHAYPIYSVYFDSAGLGMYRAAVQGQKNRYKLRVRYYDHRPGSPLFCEIKRRVNDVILKQRAVIRRDAFSRLLAGCSPGMHDLFDPTDGESHDALLEYWRVCHAMQAVPKMIIYYEREAWISPHDDSVRITFDRAAGAAHYQGTLQPDRIEDSRIPDVILELKFDDRFPLWMRELSQSCDLYRTTIGKYVHSVEQIPFPMRPFAYHTV